MKKDVLYFIEKNNEDLLQKTEFKLFSSPSSNGSLIVNLILTKKIYEKEKKEDVSTYEKLILIGKINALQVMIDESNLYSKFYDNTVDYKEVVQTLFHHIKDFKNKALKSLDFNNRNEALVNLSSSDEVDHVLSLIEENYIGG